MQADRAKLVSAAGETIRRGSKSFHMASRLFDRPTRERAWLLYSWCRHCDDECDGQTLGHRSPDKLLGRVAELETLTRLALAGEATDHLPYQALRTVLAECAIPHLFVLDHVRGFALDAQGWRPEDESELLAYCYHVAGVVGCMMAVVMGVDPEDEETLAAASDLGIAFQLSNIARDVRDDHEVGRCYLPSSWLRSAGLNESNLLHAQNREKLVGLVARLTDLAERYEASACQGLPKLGFRSRWAIIAAMGIYGRIGRRVAELGPGAWDGRVVVAKREKLAIMMLAFKQALAR